MRLYLFAVLITFVCPANTTSGQVASKCMTLNVELMKMLVAEKPASALLSFAKKACNTCYLQDGEKSEGYVFSLVNLPDILNRNNNSDSSNKVVPYH